MPVPRSASPSSTIRGGGVAQSSSTIRGGGEPEPEESDDDRSLRSASFPSRAPTSVSRFSGDLVDDGDLIETVIRPELTAYAHDAAEFTDGDWDDATHGGGARWQ